MSQSLRDLKGRVVRVGRRERWLFNKYYARMIKLSFAERRTDARLLELYTACCNEELKYEELRAQLCVRLGLDPEYTTAKELGLSSSHPVYNR